MKMKSLIAALLMAGILAMGQKVKAPKEGEAVNAVLTATTPDARIAAADNLLSKYKDTAFKSIALQMAGESYAQKGDGPNAIVYGDRAIEADAKNFQALLLVSSQIARMTKDPQNDRPFRPVKITHIKIVKGTPATTAKPATPAAKKPATTAPKPSTSN